MKVGNLLAGALASLFAVDVLAQTPAPWLGTWKLNVARSTYKPGPPPRDQIVKNQAAKDGGFTCHTDTVAPDGKQSSYEYFAKPDGKEYPMKGGAADAIWLKKIDDYTNEWAILKGGEVLVSGRTVYSRDGKVRTLTWTGTSAQGPSEGKAVFDRQ